MEGRKYYSYDDSRVFAPNYNLDYRGSEDGGTWANESPLEPGVFLLPARATWRKPPETPLDPEKREVFVHNESTNRWSKKQDWRGVQYWMPEDWEHPDPQKTHGDDFGPPPKNAMFEQPPIPEDVLEAEVREEELDQVVTDIQNSFLRLPLNARAKNLGVKSQILECLYNFDFELAEHLARQLDQPLQSQVIGIIPGGDDV